MMSKPIRVSMPTRMNWLIDAVVFVGGLLAGLSGIYFLYLPSGGYQGGRNPTYGLRILFERHTWSDLHIWGGVVMMAAIAVHFAIHWQWVKRMSRRSVNALLARNGALSRGAKVNVAIDLLVAVSFLLCAVSGVYFLFAPSGGFQGGRNPGWDPGFLFSRTTWDLLHTWSGVVLGIAAVVHLAIHWRWVKNVTVRFFLSLRPQPKAGLAAPAGKTTLASSNQS
jgi:cytochrome b subunit of formate dehydrogenase